MRLQDARWGTLRVITSEVRPGNDGPRSAHLLVLDPSGRALLRRDWNWGFAEIRPNHPSRDGSGNAFVLYNPGRYDGLIVLRAVGGRVEDFGTLPSDQGDDDYEGRGPFGYYADTVDVPPRDGVLEIRQRHCVHCVEGDYTVQLYAWDGAGYEPRGPASHDYGGPSTG